MEHAPPQPIGTDGTARLAAHAADCDECRRAPLPLDELGTLLCANQVDIDAGGLSRRILARVRPELERRASHASWPQVLAGVLVALLPLPAVLAYDVYLLSEVYSLASLLLPAGVAAYLVLNYAAFLVLLFALTYAAIPVLLMRDGRHELPAEG